MKAAVCCLNSKYIHSSTAPWCLFAGVRAYCTGDITAEVIEGTVNEPADGVFARIVKSEPDVVGFCTYIWNVERVLELASRVKKELPGNGSCNMVERRLDVYRLLLTLLYLSALVPET